MGIEEVMSFVMEKWKEALLMMENFGGEGLLKVVKNFGWQPGQRKRVYFSGQGLLEVVNFGGHGILEVVNFGGYGLLKLVDFGGHGLLELVDFGGHGLLEAVNFGGHGLLKLVDFGGHGLLEVVNFGGHGLLEVVNFGGHGLLKLVDFGGQLLPKLVNFGGQLLVSLQNFFGQVLLRLKIFGWQVLDNSSWQVKNSGGQLMSWFERINHLFPVALPEIIIIALLLLALFKYCCYRHGVLMLKEEEAKKLKELLKRKEAESIRLSEIEKRQKQRVEEMRETQKKDLENMKLKEQIRAEVGKELSKLEMTCCDMVSVLHGLGINVGNGTSHEVRVAYKKALMKFHPDKVSRSDIRQQVEAEEKFKLIFRMKDKYLTTL